MVFTVGFGCVGLGESSEACSGCHPSRPRRRSQVLEAPQTRQLIWTCNMPYCCHLWEFLCCFCMYLSPSHRARSAFGLTTSAVERSKKLHSCCINFICCQAIFGSHTQQEMFMNWIQLISLYGLCNCNCTLKINRDLFMFTAIHFRNVAFYVWQYKVKDFLRFTVY